MTIDELIKDLEEKGNKLPNKRWDHETHGTDSRGTGLIWAVRDDWEPGMVSSPNIKTVCRVDHVLSGWNSRSDEEFESMANYIAAANPENVMRLIEEVKRLRENARECEALNK